MIIFTGIGIVLTGIVGIYLIWVLFCIAVFFATHEYGDDIFRLKCRVHELEEKANAGKTKKFR